MVRDSVQLETAVNTISHEYLLKFTSEYGISEMLHPELPGPGDRIIDFPEGKVDECVFPTVVDWRTNASKDRMPTNGTYSVEAVRALDTHRTPIQKQPEMLLCLVEMDLFSLIRTLNPTKMDEPAAATDSSGVSSAVEKSPLDFAHEDGASDQGTTAPEVPSPEDVPATAAPEVGQSEGAIAAEPPVARESRKRGHDGIDATAPPKLLRRDHAGLRPSGAHVDVSDPDPLSFADASSHHPVNVAQSSQGVAAAGDPESENVSSPAEVGSPGSVYRPEWGVTNGSLLDTPEACQDLVDHAAPPGYFSELRHMHNKDFLWQYNINLSRQVAMGSQLRLRLMPYNSRYLGKRHCKPPLKSTSDSKTSWWSNGRRWVIGYGLRFALMKCAESFEMRQAFADVVSAGVAKGMSEGLKHGVEHGHAQLTVESLEAYDPEAEAKFAAALQLLKDLKYPLLDQLEGLKDAPMDVIMAALYLESDTGGMPHNLYSTSVPAPLSSPSSCTRRSDGVLVSVPTVVPQGLALLLVDAAT
nr:hypothetical protein [Tanacetum cinerariifolium]